MAALGKGYATQILPFRASVAWSQLVKGGLADATGFENLDSSFIRNEGRHLGWKCFTSSRPDV